MKDEIQVGAPQRLRKLHAQIEERGLGRGDDLHLSGLAGIPALTTRHRNQTPVVHTANTLNRMILIRGPRSSKSEKLLAQVFQAGNFPKTRFQQVMA